MENSKDRTWLLLKELPLSLAWSSDHFCHRHGCFFPLLLETLLLGKAAAWPPVWRLPNAGLRFWNILRYLPALVKSPVGSSFSKFLI